ncbi:uncharacterized protein LY79DRAFT_584972 [Colletotrichum navitas]|uniref:Uncharacterized protein n=1 Tax=Colletotrichum navitas TaxID=681940 RepID=A0AAD8UYK9_9PEZI|nr:uncharacterized protein LY79DRAFT_584972 [Colletotrichum navitas]KAK1566150.1 hypothetical protein LY79DRAFT_584972 [Colletotrichum navitas]
MPNCNFSFKTKAKRFQASQGQVHYKQKHPNIIIKEEEEGDPSKISKYFNLIVLSYTITSIDSKSYLGVIGFEALDSAHTGVYLSKVFKSNIIEGYNIPFSRVIREIKELNTTEKEKVLKANTKRELNYHKEQQKPIVGDLKVKVKEDLKEEYNKKQSKFFRVVEE